ncbi:MAG: serine hydrolase [Paenibacillus sp.]|nr:serine hydrolase [Paenibacillus sp.]
MNKKLGIWVMWIAFLTTICSLSSIAQAAPVLEKEAIDKYVEKYIHRNGLPGASIVVVKDGEIIYEEGYGHDSEGKPLTKNSLMRIASVSKSFTAFAVLQLVDEGNVNLDDPIVKYLSELKMEDPRLQQVTIRQLMSHTSGIPNPTIVAKADTLEEGVNRLHDWQLQSNPGAQYAYSNANFWILAQLVEKVSGEKFAHYLDMKVFSPLGMDDTLSPINSSDTIPGMPQGYVTAYGTAVPVPELEKMFIGSGGIVTTASDMGKWLSMHTRDGLSSSGDRLLSKSLLDESYSPQLGIVNYGLGWSLSSSYVKPQRISHSGSVTSFQAQQDIIPSSGYAVAVLLNSFTTTFEHAYEISSGIIQLTEGQTPTIKAPVPKIIDLSIGALTLLYLGFGILGILRSKKWSHKRNQRSTLRYSLRLIPQLIPIVGIGWLFFIVPNLQDNSAVIQDVFSLWPALTIFLATIFLYSVVVTGMRIYYRVRRGES